MRKPRPFTRWIAVLVLGLATFFLCLRIAMVETLPPLMSLGIVTGNHPNLYLEAAKRSSLTVPSPSIAEHAAAAASQAPLAEEPFLAAAGLAMSRDNDRNSGPLLAEAVRRNPRLRQAHMLLLERNARSGNVDEMASHMIILARLMPDANETLVGMLSQLVIEPSTRSATIRALRGNSLVEGVLNQLAILRADPDLIVQVSGTLPAKARVAGSPWQDRLVTNLVQDGEIARARRFWSEFTPGASSDDGLLYNTSFSPGSGSPPFNWKFADGAGGVAESTQRGVLAVTYYGREPAELAAQLLSLPRGNYRLSFEAVGDAIDESGDLGWTMACLSASAPFARIAIENGLPAGRRYAGTFRIPEQCPAQLLTLVGFPGDAPHTLSIEISNLRLERAP